MPAHCSACGADIPASATTCPSCGLALPLDATTVARPRIVTPRPDPHASPHGRFVPGTVLADRYRIVALLGRGGMGEVYRADDLTLGEPVALKFMSALGSDDKRLAMFREEARLSRQLAHPHICRVYDIGEIDGMHYLSMAYIDGENLRGLFKRVGRLSSDKALQLAVQLCSALAAAHDKGVLHRDLKPANIMIDGRGDAHIADFGVAAVIGQTDAPKIVGTPAYMAPEQRERGEASVQSDLYALGLILFELFTGRSKVGTTNAPDSVDTLDALSDTDPAIERVILQCLADHPSQRPHSADELAEALREKGTATSKAAKVADWAVVRWDRKASWWRGVILVVGLVLALVAGVMFRYSKVFGPMNAASYPYQAYAQGAIALVGLSFLCVVVGVSRRPLLRALSRLNIGLALFSAVLAGFTVIGAGPYWDEAMAMVVSLWLVGVVLGNSLTVIVVLLLPAAAPPGPVCPNCKYSLVGVREHRCPECGRPFTLRELGIRQSDLSPMPKGRV
ncbi:MAG: protein kinase domain-containing protein [Phycisphaeraceae bacterium]